MLIDPVLPVTHIIVGTKAQFIKMAPVARMLEERGRPYRLLDLGQHGSITPGILQDFGLRPDHLHVLPAGKTVATYGEAARWAIAALARTLSSRENLKNSLLRLPPGYALIHGDTLSTLLGLYLAKRLGMKVGLVEAGLSSGKLLDPFPEEIIRRHAEKHVDYLFAPGEVPVTNLLRKGIDGRIVDTGYNTGRDALLLVANQASLEAPGDMPRTVMTLHRAETISRPARLKQVVDHVVQLAPEIGPVEFYLHEPTRRSLTRARLLDQLKSSDDFRLHPLGSYREFTHALASAQYILTDGGSIQEEASYLAKPCLILRRTTERQEGLGKTASLTTFDKGKDLEFLRAVVPTEIQYAADASLMQASRTIVEAIQ